MLKQAALIGLTTALLGSVAHADPVLPDFNAATFDASSSVSGNTYFPFAVGQYWVYEGEIDEEFERVETVVTAQTRTILGVEARVIRSTEYIDGVLAEIALDWFATDTDGNVWYLGEFVENFDEDGDFEDNEGSWEAGVDGAQAGIIMFASPQVGDEYFQESAPGVAFDFAEVLALDGMVDIDFGSFNNVLVTGEGNLFDDPEPTIVEQKLYAQGLGLILGIGLDDEGEPEGQIELIETGFGATVPEPASAALLALSAVLAASRRRRPRHA